MNTTGSGVITGEVRDSVFAYNYIGAFTWAAKDMKFIGNSFHDNVLYGLDPHDDSSNLLIENNQLYDNGLTGLILATKCSGNVVRGNSIYNNRRIGLQIDGRSNNNLIEKNVIYGNSTGIIITDSRSNVVIDNVIRNNRNAGVFVAMPSRWNRIRGNYVYGNSEAIVYRALSGIYAFPPDRITTWDKIWYRVADPLLRLIDMRLNKLVPAP